MDDFKLPKEWPPITNEQEAAAIRGMVEGLERDIDFAAMPRDSHIGAEIRRTVSAMRWRLREWDNRDA